MGKLENSFQYCRMVARTRAKNFYYSFLLLSRPQRQAMCAIYAFMRYCDDLSDAEGISDRAGAIARWQADLDAALAGNAPEHPVWPAFADAVARYRIPHEYFRAMIRGVSSDLEPRHVQTFQELYDYCYHVASVVGLTIIHIFGFDNPRALELANEPAGLLHAHVETHDQTAQGVQMLARGHAGARVGGSGPRAEDDPGRVGRGLAFDD